MDDGPDYASCCILSYNRPQFLRDSIVSLIQGANHPLELIVHDDGSMERGVRELLHYLLDEGLVSSVIFNRSGHNQGQGTALNRMFTMATGDPIIKLDQDLIYEPAWLATVVQLLHRNPWVGLLGLFHYHAEPVDSAKTGIEPPGGKPADGVGAHTHICGSGFAVPRHVWEALGPFSEHSEAFAEDWEFQKKVTNESPWACALPTDDLVRNIGFGVGPSTVVVDHGKVATINDAPYVLR